MDARRRREREGAGVVTAAMLLAALACSRPAELRYEAELEQAPASAAHAVHDVRLLEVMRGLDDLRRDRLPQAIDPAEAEARQAREVARVALAMAESARRINGAARAQLDGEDLATFEALADRLARLCESLASEAESLDARVLRDRLDEIDATCTACHDRFRIPWQR